MIENYKFAKNKKLPFAIFQKQNTIFKKKTKPSKTKQKQFTF